MLNKDIEWMAAKGGLAVPAVGPAGAAYAAAIKDVASDTPRFINHYYNHYFGKYIVMYIFIPFGEPQLAQLKPIPRAGA